MLRKLVPDGRTHRLAVMVAGMLRSSWSLLEAGDLSDPIEVKELIHNAVI
jgi:hypothetical protein